MQTAYHVEVAGSFLTVSELTLAWIKEAKLKREQIISISASETQIEDGDSVIVVFYKTEVDPTMNTDLSNLKFHIAKGLQTWDEIYEAELKGLVAKRTDVVAFTHTARNIGQINVEIIWYLPSSLNYEYTARRFESRSSMDEVVNMASDYLNQFVAPHQLNSISVFEEDHPNAVPHYHAVVFHKGTGEVATVKPEGVSKIYDVKVFIGKQGLENELVSVCKEVERQGFEQIRMIFTTLNVTDGDAHGVVQVSW